MGIEPLERAFDEEGGSGIDRFRTAAESTDGDKALGDGLLDRPAQLVLVGDRRSDIDQRTKSCRHTEARTLLNVTGRQPSVVQRDAVPFHAKPRRHREPHQARLELTDLMHGQGRLMRNHASTSRPQRPTCKVVVNVGNPLDKTEETPVNTKPVSRLDVMTLSLMGVPNLDGLACGEVTPLSGGELEESLASLLTNCSHIRKLQENCSFMHNFSTELKQHFSLENPLVGGSQGPGVVRPDS